MGRLSITGQTASMIFHDAEPFEDIFRMDLNGNEIRFQPSSTDHQLVAIDAWADKEVVLYIDIVDWEYTE